MIETRRITVNGRTVRCLTAGRPASAGSADAVVFLHAFPLNAEMWQGQLRALPPHWIGCAPDFRGFGTSTPDEPGAPPRPDARLDDYVGDVLRVMDAITIPRAVFCGCSMGGYTLFTLMRRHADRVAGLVLVDTRAAADTDRDRASRQAMLELLGAQGPGAIAEQMLPRLLGETTRARRPEVGEEVRRLAAQATAGGVAHALVRMMNRPDATPMLESVSVPVLVVAGAEDVLIPVGEAEALRDRIPRSTLVVVPEAGHLPNMEQPETFNDTLWAWLSHIRPGHPSNPELRAPNPGPRLPPASTKPGAGPSGEVGNPD